MSTRSRVVAAIVAPAVVAVGAFTVDSISTSRVESDLSTRIRPAVEGSPAPSVLIHGGPTTRWAAPGTLSSVSIRAEDVDRPGLGPVAVEAEVTDLHVPESGDEDLTARSVTVSVRMTGDSLGPALGMRDVLIGAADDPSLAGGTEHRARVTGTLRGTDTRVSAFVDLVVDERGAHLVPTAPATGPGGIPDQDGELAMRRTALTLAPDVLPLGLTVEPLTVRGGTLTASGTGGPGTAPLGTLVRPDH
ncbi:MAG TPA: DUF2993 domain-containing protein [Dietzia sp.]|nr:DUF2993 domain-containing protein [Dietzia sp.]